MLHAKYYTLFQISYRQALTTKGPVECTHE